MNLDNLNDGQKMSRYRPKVLQLFDSIWRIYSKGGTFRQAINEVLNGENARTTQSNNSMIDTIFMDNAKYLHINNGISPLDKNFNQLRQRFLNDGYNNYDIINEDNLFFDTLQNSIQSSIIVCMAEMMRGINEMVYRKQKTNENSQDGCAYVDTIADIRNNLSHSFENFHMDGEIEFDDKTVDTLKENFFRDFTYEWFKLRDSTKCLSNAELAKLDNPSDYFAQNMQGGIIFRDGKFYVNKKNKMQYQYLKEFFNQNFEYYKQNNIDIMSQDALKIYPFESLPIANFNYLIAIYDIFEILKQKDMPLQEVLKDKDFLMLIEKDNLSYLIPALNNSSSIINFVNLSNLTNIVNSGVYSTLYQNAELFENLSKVLDSRGKFNIQNTEESIKSWQNIIFNIIDSFYFKDNHNRSYFSLGYYKNEKLLTLCGIDARNLKNVFQNGKSFKILECLSKMACDGVSGEVDFDIKIIPFLKEVKDLYMSSRNRFFNDLRKNAKLQPYVSQWKYLDNLFDVLKKDLDNANRRFGAREDLGLPTSNVIKNVLTHFDYLLLPTEDCDTLYWWHSYSKDNIYNGNFKNFGGIVSDDKLCQFTLNGFDSDKILKSDGRIIDPILDGWGYDKYDLRCAYSTDNFIGTSRISERQDIKY